MALSHSPQIVTDGLAFYYDMGNDKKSWKGAPTSNRIFTSPLPLSTYAYATGPTLVTVFDATSKSRQVNRYTISSVVNTARATIIVPTNSLALSTPYAFSCIWKYNGTNTASPSFIIDSTKGYPETSGGNTFSSFAQTNIVLGNGWTYSKLEFTLSASPTLGSILTFGISTGTDSSYLNNTFDLYNVQFEQNQYASPYVEGARTNTQAIVDLTNNRTVTANSLTYASDGMFSFNGSTNNLAISNPVPSNLPHTILQWIKPAVALTDTTVTTGAGRKTPLVGPGPQWSPGYWLTARNFRVHAFTEYRDHTINWVGSTSWHMIGQVFDGTSCYGIIDGVILSGGTRAAYSPGLQTNILIGAETTSGSDVNWNGRIDSTQIYNRALSAAEVRQNFQALRGRYGL